MGEQDLGALVALQRQLVLEESVINNLLKKVKDEMHKLQIEQLQLDSMILQEDKDSDDEDGAAAATSTASITNTADMDSAEKVNKEKLHLHVTNSLSNMLEGQFFVDQDKDIEEEEEEDENEMELGESDFMF